MQREGNRWRIFKRTRGIVREVQVRATGGLNSLTADTRIPLVRWKCAEKNW